MSETIDSKVVELRFDNKDFEANTRTTMSTLDKLKEKLHFPGASKGLEEICDTAKRVDFSGMSSGVETVQAKLSAMQVVGITALQNITNAAMTAGKQLTDAITIDPAKDGIYPAGTLDDSFDTILEQTNRMKDKVSSLLKYVTISTMDLKKSQFDLSDLLYSLLIDYQAQIHKKGTHIYHIQNKMDILADSEKIRVVFQNLLENQLKYRNSLMAIRAYKKGDTIIMLFYNDGEIISDQLKKQIFTPFMKGYNGSNGLGLSITKMILLQHSGNIELLKTNQGTLFKVTLPDSVL